MCFMQLIVKLNLKFVFLIKDFSNKIINSIERRIKTNHLNYLILRLKYYSIISVYYFVENFITITL